MAEMTEYGTFKIPDSSDGISGVESGLYHSPADTRKERGSNYVNEK